MRPASTAFGSDAKPGAWREQPDFPAAGVLWDLGPHLIDGALVLFGEPKSDLGLRLLPARRRLADRRRLRRDMEYPRAARHCCAPASSPMPQPSPARCTEPGSFVKYGMDPQEEILRSPQLSRRPRLGRRLGRGAGGTMGNAEPAIGETEEDQNGARGLSRLLRQHARRDRKRRSPGCPAGTDPAYPAGAIAGAQEQPRKTSGAVERSGEIRFIAASAKLRTISMT